jgi:hypothetical protein
MIDSVTALFSVWFQSKVSRGLGTMLRRNPAIGLRLRGNAHFSRH